MTIRLVFILASITLAFGQSQLCKNAGDACTDTKGLVGQCAMTTLPRCSTSSDCTNLPAGFACGGTGQKCYNRVALSGLIIGQVCSSPMSCGQANGATCTSGTSIGSCQARFGNDNPEAQRVCSAFSANTVCTTYGTNCVSGNAPGFCLFDSDANRSLVCASFLCRPNSAFPPRCSFGQSAFAGTCTAAGACVAGTPPPTPPPTPATTAAGTPAPTPVFNPFRPTPPTAPRGCTKVGDACQFSRPIFNGEGEQSGIMTSQGTCQVSPTNVQQFVCTFTTCPATGVGCRLPDQSIGFCSGGSRFAPGTCVAEKPCGSATSGPCTSGGLTGTCSAVTALQCVTSGAASPTTTGAATTQAAAPPGSTAATTQLVAGATTEANGGGGSVEQTTAPSNQPDTASVCVGLSLRDVCAINGAAGICLMVGGALRCAVGVQQQNPCDALSSGANCLLPSNAVGTCLPGSTGLVCVQAPLAPTPGPTAPPTPATTARNQGEVPVPSNGPCAGRARGSTCVAPEFANGEVGECRSTGGGQLVCVVQDVVVTVSGSQTKLNQFVSTFLIIGWFLMM